MAGTSSVEDECALAGVQVVRLARDSVGSSEKGIAEIPDKETENNRMKKASIFVSRRAVSEGL